MDLVEDDVAHDGHPNEGGEEEEDVEVADREAGGGVFLLDLRVSLDDDQEEEGEEEGHRKVQHHFVVVRPGYRKMKQMKVSSSGSMSKSNKQCTKPNKFRLWVLFEDQR